MNQPSVGLAKQQFRWRQAGASILLFQSLVLGACTTSVAPTSISTTPALSVAAKKTTVHVKNLRVIVKFKQAVAYNESAFLQTLSQQVGAPVVYLSSVSTDTHVYLLKLQAAQTPQDLVQRLSTVPSVLWAEVDAMAQPS